jgi:multiple sugar transport system substrate-binding protein
MMKTKVKITSSLLLILACLTGGCQRSTQATHETAKPFKFDEKPDAPITFLSTQLNPVEEAGKMRNAILRDFPGEVDFRPNDSSYVFNSIDSTLANAPEESLLVGALHGDLITLYEKNKLRPMDDVYAAIKSNGLQENLYALGKFDSNHTYYIPWMQATFVMIANKKALQYLPKGAKLTDLSYNEFLQWGKNIYAGTGKKLIGFPAGEKGLMHRFFQGYLYPSFTGSTLLRYRTADARKMWEYFRDLWQYVYPGSLVYSTMADPLIIDDVWIGWDHTARLVKIFEERPNDFVTFPAPIGPRGRGFMTVVSGLAIPQNVQKSGNLIPLIDYLTRPEIQIRTLKETGFFPVISIPRQKDIPDNLQPLFLTVQEQTSSPKSVLTLVPIGLGNQGSDYNKIFMLTFSEIVLDNKDIPTVLDKNARELQSILDKQNLRCWLPDISQERPCQIE